MRFVLFRSLAAIAVAAAAPLPCAEHSTEPKAELDPAEVTAAQLQVLKNNNFANRTTKPWTMILTSPVCANMNRLSGCDPNSEKRTWLADGFCSI